MVSSSAGSLREVVGDAALTAGPDDITGLAEHVAEVLGNAGLRGTLRQRGLARAAQFDWDKTTSDVLRAYRRVLQIGEA